MAEDLDAAIDALYQAPLETFTTRRNALAAERRKAGDREAAERIKSLPKPGVTAWAVNQAWWQNHDAFRAMLDAGEAERAAHAAFGRGKPADVRAASEARQRAVQAVVDAAVAALGGPGKVSPDARYRLLGTIEALASSGVPGNVRIGRLSSDLQSSGLAALSALAGGAPTVREAPPRPVIISRTTRPGAAAGAATHADALADEAARVHAARLAAAREGLSARESALAEAVADAAARDAADREARAVLDAATARVAEIEEALDRAREDERTARRARTEAARARSEAEMVRARTARDVERARGEVDALETGRGS